MVNAMIVKDKWERGLTIEKSDYVVGVDNFRVIAKSESDGMVVGGKLNCSRGVDTNLNNDKLDNNLSISDGNLFGGDGKFFGGKLNCSSTSNDKLDNNLNISLVNRELEDNKELKET